MQLVYPIQSNKLSVQFLCHFLQLPLCFPIVGRFVILYMLVPFSMPSSMKLCWCCKMAYNLVGPRNFTPAFSQLVPLSRENPAWKSPFIPLARYLSGALHVCKSQPNIAKALSISNGQIYRDSACIASTATWVVRICTDLSPIFPIWAVGSSVGSTHCTFWKSRCKEDCHAKICGNTRSVLWPLDSTHVHIQHWVCGVCVLPFHWTSHGLPS